MAGESAPDLPTRPNVIRPIPILKRRMRSDFGITMATIRKPNPGGRLAWHHICARCHPGHQVTTLIKRRCMIGLMTAAAADNNP
jgi:hypothetical protein